MMWGRKLEYLVKVLAFCLLLFAFCILETPGSVKSTLSSSSYNAVCMHVNIEEVIDIFEM